MKKISRQQVIELTKLWLEEAVIGLQLCPFAKMVWDNGLVRIKVSMSGSIPDTIKMIYDEAHHLDQTPQDQLSNTLIVFPMGMEDFEVFLERVDITEITLEDQRLDKVLQVAHFHPAYQFAGTSVEDLSNFTNRSPFPIIHLLRRDEVKEAAASLDGVEKVGDINARKMEDMGLEVIRQLWSKWSKG